MNGCIDTCKTAVQVLPLHNLVCFRCLSCLCKELMRPKALGGVLYCQHGACINLLGEVVLAEAARTSEDVARVSRSFQMEFAFGVLLLGI